MSDSATEHCTSFSRFLLGFSDPSAGVTVREQKSPSLQYSLTAYSRASNTCVNTLTAGNIFFITAPSCIIQSSSFNSSLTMPHLPKWLLFTIFVVLETRLGCVQEKNNEIFFY